MSNQQPNNNGQRDHKYNMEHNVRYDGRQVPGVESHQNRRRGVDPGGVVDRGQWTAFGTNQAQQYQAGQNTHQPQHRATFPNSRANLVRPHQGFQPVQQTATAAGAQRAHAQYQQTLEQDTSNMAFNSPVKHHLTPQQMLAGSNRNPQQNYWPGQMPQHPNELSQHGRSSQNHMGQRDHHQTPPQHSSQRGRQSNDARQLPQSHASLRRGQYRGRAQQQQMSRASVQRGQYHGRAKQQHLSRASVQSGQQYNQAPSQMLHRAPPPPPAQDSPPRAHQGASWEPHGAPLPRTGPLLNARPESAASNYTVRTTGTQLSSGSDDSFQTQLHPADRAAEPRFVPAIPTGLAISNEEADAGNVEHANEQGGGARTVRKLKPFVLRNLDPGYQVSPPSSVTGGGASISPSSSVMSGGVPLTQARSFINRYAQSSTGTSSGSDSTITPKSQARINRTPSESSSVETVKPKVVQTIARIEPREISNRPSHPSAPGLAKVIKDGLTEDPGESMKLNRKYTYPLKLVVPTFGPTRFRDSRTMGNLDGGKVSKPPKPPICSSAPKIDKARIVHSGLGPSKDLPDPLWLSTVQQGLCNPAVEELMVDLPFSELHRMVAPSNAGVIKIIQIPYATCRQDIVSFLGRNAQIIRQPQDSPYRAIHILMERESGKSMECYVEVASDAEAAFIVHGFDCRVKARKAPKIGQRTVQVLYSSQDELISELFPRAKHVRWEGGKPIVDLTPREYHEGVEAAGFQGFIHPEELVHTLRHATQMWRSKYAFSFPARPYETIISILYKYPWYAPEHVLIDEREQIYECTLKLMGELIKQIGTHAVSSTFTYRPSDPSPALLREMAAAALACPGFTEVQKARVVGYLVKDGYGYMAVGRDINVDLGGTHELAAIWPFIALSVTPGADIELVKYYGQIFQEATRTGAIVPPLPMGDVNIDYQGQDNQGGLTLAVAAKIEYAQIEEMIKEAVGETDDDGWSRNLRSRPNTPDEPENAVRPALTFEQAMDEAHRKNPGSNWYTTTAPPRQSNWVEPDPADRKAQGIILLQIMKDGQARRANDKAQMHATEDARRQNIAQVVGGVGGNRGLDQTERPTGPRATGGYTMQQAMANAEKHRRNDFAQSMAGARHARAPQDSTRTREPLHGYLSSALPGPFGDQGSSQTPAQNAQGSTREPLHGYHSSALPGPFGDQGSSQPPAQHSQRPSPPPGTERTARGGVRSKFDW